MKIDPNIYSTQIHVTVISLVIPSYCSRLIPSFCSFSLYKRDNSKGFSSGHIGLSFATPSPNNSHPAFIKTANDAERWDADFQT